MRKMKVKTVSRNEERFTRERKTDIVKMFRNADPKLHPHEQEREYTRALTATKLDKIFAKPFLGALDGHRDGVYCMTTLPTSLTTMISGACDGEIRVWNLQDRKTLWSVSAHEGFVRGLAAAPDGEHFVSCGSDKTIKLWKVNPSEGSDDSDNEDTDGEDDGSIKPVTTFLGQDAYSCISHHRRKDWFATASDKVDLWDHTRSEPFHSFAWGAESIYHAKFNPVEVNILVSTASDRNVVLYDVRTKTPIRKMIMAMSTNCIAWNPMEGSMFTTANEDHNCYTFDMRHLDHAVSVHQDHVSAVMSIDYSPTGQEFATGGYDRAVRIFPVNAGHSREIYHARRMQRIFSVQYSADSKYVLSGSDDTNIRIWKSLASDTIHTLLPREQSKTNYRNKLKKKFEHHPEIRRIARHRHLPKQIKNAQKLKHVMNASVRRKNDRRRAHKADSVVIVPAKKRKILKVED